MPKPKDSTALYEVIRKTDTSARLAETRSYEPKPELARQESPPVEAEELGTDEEAGADEVTGTDLPAPLLELAGGQVRLALTELGAVIAIALIGLLLLAGYVAGLKVGERRGHDAGYAAGQRALESDSMDEIRAARGKPPAGGLFEDIGISPVGQPEATPDASAPVSGEAASGWIRGYTYVVVQDFRADAAADVQRAKEYLLDNGVETAVIELGGDWKYRLITTQGFNWDDPVQRRLAEDCLARVRELGKAFFDAGGRYRLEGYFRKLTADTW